MWSSLGQAPREKPKPQNLAREARRPEIIENQRAGQVWAKCLERWRPRRQNLAWRQPPGTKIIGNGQSDRICFCLANTHRITAITIGYLQGKRKSPEHAEKQTLIQTEKLVEKLATVCLCLSMSVSVCLCLSLSVRARACVCVICVCVYVCVCLSLYWVLHR